MNICVLYLGRKGAGPMYAFEMAKALSKNERVFCVLSVYVENKSIWEKESNINSNMILLFVKTYTNKMNFVLSLFNFYKFWMIRKSIDKFNPLIVYSPMGHFWDCFIMPFVKCKYRIKTIHDVILHDGENSYLHIWLSRLFSYKPDKYVILSEKFKSDLLKKGIVEKDVIVIPHAVFDIYNNEKVSDIENYYNRFLFFGRIIKYKGLNVLLESLGKVVKENPLIKLVIVGDGDVAEYKCLMDKYQSNLELYLGWISDEDVATYFSNIDFVVLPYTQASQSGIIPLAYGFHKPVISTRIGGLPEQIIENQTGLLVAPNNVGELADAILYLSTNPLELKRMKENCKEYSSFISWESSAHKLLFSLNIDYDTQ